MSSPNKTPRVNVTKKEAEELYQKGLISRAVYHRTLKRGWVALGWQKRGQNIDISDLSSSLKKKFKHLIKNEKIDNSKYITTLYDKRFKLGFSAKKRVTLRKIDYSEMEEIIEDAFMHTLDALNNTKSSQIDYDKKFYSLVQTYVGKYNKKNIKNLSYIENKDF